MAVNKTDDRRATRPRRSSSTGSGFEPVVEIAAEHGEGTGDLLDEVVTAAAGALARRRPPAEPEEVAVAIVGRPNVGKSSLLNRLLNEERSIVSDMPGTTRDSVDALLRWQRRIFRIVDTAGIRRAGRVARSGQVEAVSVVLARRAIEKADVAVLVIDAVEGATDQDAAIAGEAEKAGCGIIIAANKWDLMKGQGPGLLEEVRRRAAAAGEVPRLRADASHLGDDRRARGEGARDDRQGRRVASAARADRGAEPVRLQGVTAGAPARQPRASSTCGSSTPRRPASRRRRSCSSPTSRRSFISPTSGFWRTDCASRSA